MKMSRMDYCPETNIDYVVLQPPAEDPEFYLRRNIRKW